MTEISGVGSIPIPAAVREAGGASEYKSALGFEGMLLDRLSEQLVSDSGLQDTPYASAISGAFTSSLLQGGGLGLGEQLYASMMKNQPEGSK